jgi:hypothetical protein
MATTYTLIASVTVGAGNASSIDFTSIPNTYTDFCLVTSFRSNRSNNVDDIYITLNGSTSSFSNKYLQGNGSSASSGSLARYYGSCPAASGSTANTFSNDLLYIPNYAGSAYKSFSGDTVMEYNGNPSYAAFNAGLWSNNAAITSLSLSMTGSFVQYSTAYLYGISNS